MKNLFELNTKRVVILSIILLLPAIFILGSISLQSVFNISLPPVSILKEYSPGWPLWIRFGIFAFSVIIFPIIAVSLNVLSVFVNKNSFEKKYRAASFILVSVSGILALLFIGHTIADCIAGTH